MKPFNLDEALTGKPVLLRDGSKAFVKFAIPNPIHQNEKVVGYVCYDDGETELITWTIDGDYMNEKEEYSFDIIGMFAETINIGGIAVPKPETEPPAKEIKYYYPVLTNMDKFNYGYWANSEADNRLLRLGLVHLTEEAAIAHTEALLVLNKSAIEEAG